MLTNYTFGAEAIYSLPLATHPTQTLSGLQYMGYEFFILLLFTT